MKRIWLAAVVGIWASALSAHSPLIATTPANDAIVAEAPTQIDLEFKNEIRLTRVILTYEEKSTDLNLSGHKGFISEYAVPLAPAGSGAYVIDWRGLGEDGHPMNGSFSFTVK